jgi:hypothetical protein
MYYNILFRKIGRLILPFFVFIKIILYICKKTNMELDLIIYSLLLMFALQCILILIVGLVLKNKLNDMENTINEYVRMTYKKS